MTFPQQQTWAPQAAPTQQPWTQQPAMQAPAVVPKMGPGAWRVEAAQDAGGNGVAMAHLLGRTVAIVPLELLADQPIRNQPGKVQDVVKADIFILDGGPFTFGGSPRGKPTPTPDTMAVDALPFLAENSRIYGQVIVNQLRPKVGQGVAVGRIVEIRTGSGNDAWSITTDPTPEQLQLVQQLVTAHYQDRTFVNPTVRMLAGPQMQMAQQNPGYGQMPPQMGIYPQQPPQPQWPTQQASPYGPMGGQAAPIQAQPWQPQQAPPAPPAPVADWTLTTIPRAVPADQVPAYLQQTTQEQRLQFLAAEGITGPNQGGMPPTGL